MRIATLMTGLLALGLFSGCGGYNGPTGPSTGGGGTGGGGPYGGGNNGGGGSGGGGNDGGGPSPATAAVSVGNILFRSAHNATVNPAVDSVAIGGTVTWTWDNNGATPHSVLSVGSPSFTSSAVQTAAGSTYQMTFPTAGVYHYQCSVHGTAMTGTIVVR
jgi:plastocyanin